MAHHVQMAHNENGDPEQPQEENDHDQKKEKADPLSKEQEESEWRVNASLTEAHLFKKIIESIKELVSNANLRFTTEGITLQAMDSSHVALVHMHLSASLFTHYECKIANLVLGVNVASISKIMMCCDKEDSVVIRNSIHDDVLEFVFVPSPNQKKKSSSASSSRFGKTSRYALKLLDIDEGETLQIPETQYSAVIELPSPRFTDICKNLAIMGDTVLVETNSEAIRFTVNGDIGSANITVEPTKEENDEPKEKEEEDNKEEENKNEAKVTLAVTEPTRLSFALRYLGMFCKAAPLASQVSINMQQDVPLKIKYIIGGDDAAFISFYLAPKIEEENHG
jgi:proliferating cell nuclear antigen